MTSLPYPIFQSHRPVLAGTSQRLAAVGRCRVYPETCDPLSVSQFHAIVANSLEQAKLAAAAAAAHQDNDNKAARKKLAKEGVSMAKAYLEESLELDTSIVDIEVVLSAENVLESDGLLATCFLDAGCDAIVVPMKQQQQQQQQQNNNKNVGFDFSTENLDALDAARVPRERLVAHFDAMELFCLAVQNSSEPLSQLCTCVSVNISDLDPLSFSLETLTNLLGLATTTPKKDGFRVVVTLAPSSFMGSLDQLVDLIGRGSRFCGEKNPSTVALIDATPEQLGLSYAACMKTDREDGLFTTVVCTRSGEALGLVYSSKASVVAALECGRGVYYSRSRRGLWRKGDTSGHYQVLHRIDVDCDGDAMRFTVTQRGQVAAFCHLNTLSCWGEPRGWRHLEGTLQRRLREAPAGSYTKRLFDDPDLLRNKLVEEAQELAEAEEVDHVTEELADVLYFAMVRAAKAGVSMDDAAAALDRRARKVTRRKGDAKAYRIAAGDEILDKKKKGP